MGHVGPDEMTGSQGGAEGQFAGEDAGADDACELARVVAGVCRVRAAHAQHIEHCGLWLEDGAAA